MTASKKSFIRRLWSGFWMSVTRVRLLFSNILFLAVVIFLFVMFSGNSPEPLPERAALLLNPVGSIVEQKSPVDPVILLWGEQPPQEREVLLRDIIDAITYARDDERITALVMDLEQLFALGISKTGDIAAALDDFRASGKPIVAWNDSYNQGQYLLAAEADTVILHPLGGVALEGFSNYQWYIREALDRLYLTMHVFRAGDHKSFVEPYLRDDMSPGEREVSSRWLNALWDHYTARVEYQRELEAGAVNAYIENFVARLGEAGGDMALAAREAGLVDELLDRLSANAWLADLVGATDEDGNYQAIAFQDYLVQRQPGFGGDMAQDERPKIAVITAQGMILDGEQPPGTIGGDTLAALLRDAVDDESVAALVLRIDSGGGSAFASEVIRQQILYARENGKPVVASMGSVAASGGYWIAAPADEIWASPTTITGSIGVFAAFPTVERLLERVGVSTDGVGTTSLAGSYRADRALNPVIGQAMQASVDSLYRRFVGLVAGGRNMTPEAVEAVAGGRVWSARDALEQGLVDNLGGLHQAVEAAAELAGLSDYQIDYNAPELSPQELLVQQLLGSVGALVPNRGATVTGYVEQLLAPVAASLEFAATLNDPNNMYARCQPCLAP